MTRVSFERLRRLLATFFLTDSSFQLAFNFYQMHRNLGIIVCLKRCPLNKRARYNSGDRWAQQGIGERDRKHSIFVND